MCVSEKRLFLLNGEVDVWCPIQGKDDKFECSSFGGISLLSVVGNVYGRVLVQGIRCGTESMVGEEQSGFRKGRGCIDQVFVVKQM